MEVKKYNNKVIEFFLLKIVVSQTKFY